MALTTSIGASAGGMAMPLTILALPVGWYWASDGETPPVTPELLGGAAPPEEADAPPPDEDDLAAYEVALNARIAASAKAAASNVFAVRMGISFVRLRG